MAAVLPNGATTFGVANAGASAIQADGKVIIASTNLSTSNSILVTRLNTNGTKDTSFGSSGTRSFKFDATATLNVPTGIDVHTDGTIVVVGYVQLAGGRDSAVAKLTAAGALDTSFSSDGLLTLNVAGSTIADSFAGVAIQPDGKIVAVGSIGTTSPTLTVLRISTAGALDTGFGTGGMFLIDYFGQGSVGTAIQLDSSNRPVVVGYATFSGRDAFSVMRLTTAGALDPTFNFFATGYNSFYVSASDQDRATSVAIQPDGKIVIAGRSSSASDANFAVARVSAVDGNRDSTFNGSGNLVFGFAGADTTEGATSVAVQSDSKILVSGNVGGTAVVARRNTNGSADSTFASASGRAGADLFDPDLLLGSGVPNGNAGASSQNPWGVYPLSDGRIVLAGTLSTFWDGDGSSANGREINATGVSMVRLLANGPLDADVPATVTTVSVPANGSYRAGQNLDFTVAFNEAITVTGSPSLSLTIGSASRSATYVSGSGNTSLLFRYTVAAGDNDANGIALASPISGGTLKDSAGVSATLTFSPPSTAGVLVDTTAPTAPTGLGTTPTSPANNTNPSITGTAEANSTINLYTNAAGSGSPVATGTATGGSFSIPVTVQGTSTTTFYATATDAAGNVSPVSAGVTYVELAVAPTVNTPTATSVTSTSATLGGNVASDGGAAITERGVVFSLTSANSNPQIGGTGVTKITSSGTTGTFTVSATGLAPLSGYLFAAYAINSIGTTYTSPASTFTTQETPSLVVTTKADTANPFDNLTSLREAIARADALAGADTITFGNGSAIAGGTNFTDSAADTITLAGTQLTIPTSLTIAGPAASLLTISGNNLSRIFNIDDGNAVTFISVALSGLTISAGNPGTGQEGGGILNRESLTITNSVVTGNTTLLGGGIASVGASGNPGTALTITSSTITGNQVTAHGGGVFNQFGVATITGSTLSGNTAADFGGGLCNLATAIIQASTLSGNTAGADGGGVYSENGSVLTISRSTLSGNSAAGSGGGVELVLGTGTFINATLTGNRADFNGDSTGDGGGVHLNNNISVTLLNTLIAGNFKGTGSSPSDVVGTLVSGSASNNLIGDAATAGGLAHGASGNIIGVNGAGVRSIATILDAVLKDNGGRTNTHALVQNSLAIGAASQSVSGYIGYDQRDAARDPSDPDIGAYEVQHPLSPVGTPSTYADTFLPRPSASATEAFVKGLYQSTLLRGPDPAGLASWVAALNGGASRESVAFGFVNSVENRTNQVTFFYKYFLGRTPDPVGLQTWVSALQSGVDEGAVMSGFLLSPEFTGQNDNASFVNLMYYAILGRQAEPDGFNFWVGELNANRQTRDQVGAGFLRSIESITRVVVSDFASYLKRTIPSSGATPYVSQIQSGVTFGRVAANILGADEFFVAAGQNLG